MDRLGYIPPAPQLPGLVAPYHPSLVTNLAVLATAGTIYACRVVVQKAGTLHDLASMHSVASGNHRLGIYDTGDYALANGLTLGTRKLLYDSGSVAVATPTPPWQAPGADPALVVQKGQHLDFVQMADNTTATFPRTATPSSNQHQLPASFLPCAGGALAKLAWAYAVGAYAAFPDTIAETNCGTSAGVIYPCIIARVA